MAEIIYSKKVEESSNNIHSGSSNIINHCIHFCISRPAMRDIVSKTNLVVLINDPVLTSNLGELLLTIQSGLAMGSQKAGLMNPQGTLLMTCNEPVNQR